MPRPRFLKHFFPESEQPSGERPKGDVFAVGEELPTPVPSQAETIVMLREMLNSVLEENNRLNEQVLELQNALDREREKKLQSP